MLTIILYGRVATNLHLVQRKKKLQYLQSTIKRNTRKGRMSILQVLFSTMIKKKILNPRLTDWKGRTLNALLGIWHHRHYPVLYLVTQSLRPRGLQPARLLCPWDSPGKNTGVGCYALLQGIFLTQGSNPRLLCCRWTVYRLSHQGKPQIMLTGLKQNLLKLMSLSITPAKKLNTIKTQLPLQGRKTSFSFQAFWLA